jgi:hypothetical protein
LVKRWILQFRLWWHQDIIAVVESLRPPVHTSNPDIIHCPICRAPYDIKDIPQRVNHVTLVCNNPKCGEHMDLTRSKNGWKVDFRDRERL